MEHIDSSILTCQEYSVNVSHIPRGYLRCLLLGSADVVFSCEWHVALCYKVIQFIDIILCLSR